MMRFEDFGDFAESITRKMENLSICGSNPCRGATRSFQWIKFCPMKTRDVHRTAMILTLYDRLDESNPLNRNLVKPDRDLEKLLESLRGTDPVLR